MTHCIESTELRETCPRQEQKSKLNIYSFNTISVKGDDDIMNMIIIIVNNIIHYSSDYLIRTYQLSGGCTIPLESVIKPGANESSLFAKTPCLLRGVVGVFTYDLSLYGTLTSDKMAVMFSVPFNFSVYENWFAVGVFNRKKKCDYDLYYEMYYNNESSFVRGKAKDGALTYAHGKVVIKAWMSDTYTPLLKVIVSDTMGAFMGGWTAYSPSHSE